MKSNGHPWARVAIGSGRSTILPGLTQAGLLLTLWFALSAAAQSPPSPAPTHRQTPVSPELPGHTGFTSLPPGRTGITFTNLMPVERALTNQIFLNGSGVAAGDVDGDGLCDLFFAAAGPACVLYRNLGGWRFEDITAAAGVACSDQVSSGAAFADVDGDGDLDLLVTGVGRGTRLFLNDGHGHFTEATRASGLESRSGSTSVALADIDGDGDLDLYVVNYRSKIMGDEPEKRFRIKVNNGVYELQGVDGLPADAPGLTGRFTVDPVAGVLENGEPDQLYLNDGQGRFTPVDWTAGRFLNETGGRVAIPYDWGLSAQFHDLNGDGAPDLYVCNDFQSPDRIWINDGRGNFRAISTHAIRQTSLFSMGVDFADIDRDGHVDFFVADMLSRQHQRRLVQLMDRGIVNAADPGAAGRPQFSRNTLFRNRGDGTFAEIARLAGVDASEWSWSPVFLDVDLDGFEDLLITTGHARDSQNADAAASIEAAKRARRRPLVEELGLRRMFPVLDTPNVAFRNRGDLTFEDIGPAWGFDSRRISHGMALADLDNDGDLDCIVNCLNDGPLLLRNDTARPRIRVRLRGLPPNTRGIGARIRVEAPGLPVQSQEMISGGRYLSCDDTVRTFAAGAVDARARIEITWRNGRRTTLEGVEANSLVEIVEVPDLAPAPTSPPAPVPTPWFADVSDRLRHQHTSEPFDDFARQRLLPRRWSQSGPGVSWFDFNSDGWPDLMIGAGRGGRLAVFRNDTHGGFVPQKAGILQIPVARDLTTVLGWRRANLETLLLLGFSGAAGGRSNAVIVRQFSLVTGRTNDLPDPTGAGAGPIAMADVDGDGHLDAFVGGRPLPGRYPEAGPSQLLGGSSDGLVADQGNAAVLAGLGVVNGAVFTDLDLDGDPDLVVACDWGPLKILRNQKGRFEPWHWTVVLPPTHTNAPQSVLLETLTGWWNSVATGDFDGDGRPDIVAGNWGRNFRDRRHLARPLELYFGDADGDGALDLIEAYFDAGLGRTVPARDWKTLSGSFPSLRDHFSNFTTFASAGMDDVLGAGLPAMKSVNMRMSDSMVFLNRGDHLEAHPLPIEAQFAPVFGIAVGDLDGDGNEDLFLAQNFFGVSSAESRFDAGTGTWLRGDGQGGFQSVPPAASGISLEGEGRGAALADYDHDGRLDLVVGQQQGVTRLLHNERARPAVRLRLAGEARNPDAIGARIRLRFRDGTLGPLHEVHAGSGYWSQDGSDVLLATPREPAAIEIRWPDGRETRLPVPAGARELQASPAP